MEGVLGRWLAQTFIILYFALIGTAATWAVNSTRGIGIARTAKPLLQITPCLQRQAWELRAGLFSRPYSDA